MALHYKKITSTHKKKVATLIVVGSLFAGGVNANAAAAGGIIDKITQFVGGAFSSKNSEALADRIMVTTSQTAITPNQISAMMEASTKALIAAGIAEKQAFAIKGVVDAMKFPEPERLDPETGKLIPPITGGGLSSDLNCEALATKTLIQSKDKISDAENYNAHSRLASLYNTDPSVKRTNRVMRHIEFYCDVTEVSKGVCTFPEANMGSADTNYSALYSNDVLSMADVDAAVAYILNVVDPASTKISGCDTEMCNTVTAVNTSYQALANVAQGAFVNQMTDRMYYEYQGSKAGKELGKKNSIVVGGGGATSPADPNAPVPPVDPTKPVDPNAPKPTVDSTKPVDPNAPQTTTPKTTTPKTTPNTDGKKP